MFWVIWDKLGMAATCKCTAVLAHEVYYLLNFLMEDSLGKRSNY